METTEGRRIRRDILIVFAFEILCEECDKTIIEIFTSKVGITSSGLDLENTILFDSQKRDIESSTSEIKNKDVPFAGDLLVEAVGDSSSDRVVDNLMNVKTSDGSSILSSLSLGVIKVSRNSDDSVGDSPSKVSLGSLLHLKEDH
jgi:hypothetical protein